MYAEEAKERQGARNDINIKEKFPESNEGQARDKAAKALNTNGRVTPFYPLILPAPNFFWGIAIYSKTFAKITFYSVSSIVTSKTLNSIKPP